MSVEIWEKFGSRDGQASLRDSASDLIYMVQGTADDAEAYAAVIAGTAGLKQDPLSPLLLVRQSIAVTQVGPTLWEATVHFGHPDRERSKEPEETGEEGDFSFDTTGGSQHITCSPHGGWQAYPKPGEAAPDFQGAIGVSGPPDNRQVEGVDVQVPSLKFTRTKYQSASLVTPAWVKQLSRVTGRKNAAPFWGFDAGEVLFRGATGSRRGRGDWAVNYHFDASQNIAGLQIGDIQGIAKLGWDYLWVYFEPVEDANAMALVQRPKAAYVHKVVQDGDFGQLGL
jgi:hypothetical protein